MNDASTANRPHFDRINVDPALAPITEMEVEDFYALPQEEQLNLGKTINKLYRPAVNELFVGSGLRWIAIGVPSGEILARGEYDEAMPTTIAQTQKLARECLSRSVPFVFVPPITLSPSFQLPA